MALYRIDTKHFEVVNLSDPSVQHAGETRPNEWVAASSVAVGPDATTVRVRAVTRPEVDSCPMDRDPEFLAGMIDIAVHPDDKTLVASLPWHFQRTLGALVFRVSTVPLDLAK
jgi:hypothetical protein